MSGRARSCARLVGSVVVAARFETLEGLALRLWKWVFAQRFALSSHFPWPVIYLAERASCHSIVPPRHGDMDSRSQIDTLANDTCSAWHSTASSNGLIPFLVKKKRHLTVAFLEARARRSESEEASTPVAVFCA